MRFYSLLLAAFFATSGFAAASVWFEELFVVAFLEIFVVCLACVKRQSLRSTKTFDSDRRLCFQLDKHEVKWGGTIKKEPRFSAPKPHSGEISTTNIFSSYNRRQLATSHTADHSGRARPRRQRHTSNLGRDRRSSAGQPCHRPSLKLATLRQIIPHATPDRHAGNREAHSSIPSVLLQNWFRSRIPRSRLC